MPSAIKSQGTKLAYSIGSPTTFVDLGNIVDVDGIGGGSAAVIDTSNLDSVAKEKLPGLPDEGQATVKLNLDPGNAGHVAMRNARLNQTRLEFRVTLVDTAATKALFFGYVLAVKVSVGVNKQVMADMTIEIDGLVTWI